MTDRNQRMEELLDELFDSITDATSFLQGIRHDIGVGEYDMSRIEGDIDYMETKFSVESIMKELLEIRDAKDVDVWSHFGGVK